MLSVVCSSGDFQSQKNVLGLAKNMKGKKGD